MAGTDHPARGEAHLQAVEHCAESEPFSTPSDANELSGSFALNGDDDIFRFQGTACLEPRNRYFLSSFPNITSTAFSSC
jgi:hypothetical protein